MEDTLARERLVNNLLDQVATLQARVKRLEDLLLTADRAVTAAMALHVETGGPWRLVVEESGAPDGMAWLVMEEV